MLQLKYKQKFIKERLYMAVYVDEAVWEWKGKKWCHLLADSLEELHEFAQKIGLQKSWFQQPPKVRYPHYDITESRRMVAIKKGAIEVNRRDTIVKAKLLKDDYDRIIAEKLK